MVGRGEERRGNRIKEDSGEDEERTRKKSRQKPAKMKYRNFERRL